MPQTHINDYVGWMLRAHQCCAVKVVNAGGIDAFKYNQRHLDVDEPHAHYGITPRQILRTLATAVESLGLAHPLHVHCSNLGVAGNIASTLATINAVEGRRLHLTHAQFHCYGTDGPHGYSSAAHQLADVVNENPGISVDVGQLHFGQTVTLSGDTMHQFANRNLARPRKNVFQDTECQAGCGVLPFRYRHDQYVHGLLWSIGMELFLRI
jgi:formylmethanofuran dehydrogenase subunit A